MHLTRLVRLFANAVSIVAGCGKDDASPGVLGVYKAPELPILYAQFGK